MSNDRQSSNVAFRKNSNNLSTSSNDSTSAVAEDLKGQNRRNPAATGGGNIFSNFTRLFASATTNPTSDRLFRTSICYASSSVPTHEVHHWVRRI